MGQVSIIGIDFAKRSFQARGARTDGSVAFRKKPVREKVVSFLSSRGRRVVAMEACASAHHRGREIGRPGAPGMTGSSSLHAAASRTDRRQGRSVSRPLATLELPPPGQLP